MEDRGLPGRDAKKRLRDYAYFEGTYKQAQLKDTELNLAARNKRQEEKQARKTGKKTFTFAEYLPYWLQMIEPSTEPSTMRTYSYDIKLLLPIIGDLILSDNTRSIGDPDATG